MWCFLRLDTWKLSLLPFEQAIIFTHQPRSLFPLFPIHISITTVIEALIVDLQDMMSSIDYRRESNFYCTPLWLLIN